MDGILQPSEVAEFLEAMADATETHFESIRLYSSDGSTKTQAREGFCAYQAVRHGETVYEATLCWAQQTKRDLLGPTSQKKRLRARESEDSP